MSLPSSPIGQRQLSQPFPRPAESTSQGVGQEAAQQSRRPREREGPHLCPLVSRQSLPASSTAPQASV